MTTYCVGCDNIVGGESDIINKVAKVLEENGNTCERLSVGPNYVQTNGNSSSSKGKVAVYLVGGSDLGTYVDFMNGMKRGYYHYKYIWFAFCSWTATTWITCEELKTRGLVRAHDDNYSSESDLAPWKGKSADYFFSKQSNMGYVCGQSPEELAKKILNGGGDSSSSEEGDSASSSTIKEALKQAVSGWDGDVEINVIEDTVYVNKIKDPTKTKLRLTEYGNVQYDSVTITDINPQTPNKVTLNYQGQELVLKDDWLIKRFEEIPLDLEVDNTVKNLDDAISFLQRAWNKIRRDDGRQVELKVNGSMKWKTGEWVRAFLPSFFIDDYMYIIRASHEEDATGNWITSLTLVDYPPSFGLPQEEEKTEETEEDSDAEDTDVTDIEGST